MRVAVVGTGYVGLVTAACLADLGHHVVCVDVDAAKVARINAMEAPLYEEGLPELLRRNVGERLTAVTDLAAAVQDADVILICVGTPFDGRSMDLQFVLAAARGIGGCLREPVGSGDEHAVAAAGRSHRYPVVAVKSTVLPGTTMGPVRRALEEESGGTAGVHFRLGVNPEFLAEGAAVRHFIEPDRIVVGGIDERSRAVIAALYDAFPDVPLILTNPTTAEMIKYASNALLATLISYSNEIAGFCERLADVDVTDVMAGVHRMRHLSYHTASARPETVSATSFLWPGCGFGGSCFPKDLKALVAQADQQGAPADLLQAVMRINARQPQRLVEHLLANMPDLAGRRIGVLGLAFKPDTDDVRESAALRVVGELVARGARVVGHDPVAVDNARSALEEAGVDLEQVTLTDRLDEAIADCEALLLVTRWDAYAALPRLLQEQGIEPLLVDGRRFIPRTGYRRYAGIGLSPLPQG